MRMHCQHTHTHPRVTQHCTLGSVHTLTHTHTVVLRHLLCGGMSGRGQSTEGVSAHRVLWELWSSEVPFGALAGTVLNSLCATLPGRFERETLPPFNHRADCAQCLRAWESTPHKQSSPLISPLL